MFRLQIKIGKEWRWGLNEYPTEKSAKKRQTELSEVGIKSRVKSADKLFCGNR